jgi:hypothetical protein
MDSVETIFTATMIRDNLQRRLAWQTGMVCGSSRQRAAELARSVTAAANEIQPRPSESAWDKHGRSCHHKYNPQTAPSPATCMCEMRCREECCDICCVYDCCVSSSVVLSVFALPLCLYVNAHSSSLRWQTPTHRQNVAQSHSKITPRPTRLSLYTFITLSVLNLSSPLVSLPPSLPVRVTRATLARRNSTSKSICQVWRSKRARSRITTVAKLTLEVLVIE